MVFPVVMYGCESWTVKKAEHQKIDAFELWYYVTAAQTMKTTFRPPRFLVRNQLLILLRIPVQFSSVHTVMSNSLCPIDWSIRWPKDWRFSLNISPPMNIQHCFLLGWNGWIALQSKGLSRVFSNTTVQKHQFLGAQLSLESNSHIHTWLLEKP